MRDFKPDDDADKTLELSPEGIHEFSKLGNLTE